MSGPSGLHPKLTFGPSINIIEPAPIGAGITKVQCPGGSGPNGVICAFGDVDLAGTTLLNVWAKVFGVTATGISRVHPNDGSSTHGSLTGSDTWAFISTLIPVVSAACPSAPPTQDNGLLVVWCQFIGGTGILEFNSSTTFAGMASTMTECDGSSGSGDENRRKGRGASRTGVQTGVETAPRQMQVTGKGFSGAGASFNARWLLTLRANGCACLWDNGGDGVKQPRVELRCGGVVATEWRLTFAHAGLRISYTCLAGEWKSLGSNQMKSSGQVREGEMPDTLVITPV